MIDSGWDCQTNILHLDPVVREYCSSMTDGFSGDVIVSDVSTIADIVVKVAYDTSCSVNSVYSEKIGCSDNIVTMVSNNHMASDDFLLLSVDIEKLNVNDSDSDRHADVLLLDHVVRDCCFSK